MATPDELVRQWAERTDPDRDRITGPEVRDQSDRAGTDVDERHGGPRRRGLVAAAVLLAVLVVVAVGVVAQRDPGVDRVRTDTSVTTTTTTTAVETGVVDRDGVPVLAGASRPAGAQLRDGLHSPEGSWLLAEPLPLGIEGSYNGKDIDDDGWLAVLLVTGDVDQVIDDLDAQIETLEPFPDPMWHVWLTLIRQDPDGLVQAPTSHLMIHFSKPSGGGPRTEPVSHEVYTPSQRLPGGWGRPARPGERFGWDLDGAKALVTPDDTYEVTHSYAALSTARHIAFGTVLRIDGDVEPVIDDLVDQLEVLGVDPTRTDRNEDVGDVTRITGFDNGYYKIDVLDGGPGHRWAFVETDPGD